MQTIQLLYFLIVRKKEEILCLQKNLTLLKKEKNIMKKNLIEKDKNLFKDSFSKSLDAEDKAWDFIGDFFHMVITHMENENIKPVELARKLKVSRARVSQLLNENLNISVKKMFKISNAIDLNIKITSDKVDILKEEYESKHKEIISNLCNTVNQSSIAVNSQNNQLVISPIVKNQYSLDAFLSEITELNIHNELDFGEPIGEELI